jgi:putative ABC transport system permease protein
MKRIPLTMPLIKMKPVTLITRSFRKDGGFGLLNILGLSIGIIMSLLIIWYLQYHISYNSDIRDAGKIYWLVSKDRNNGNLSYGNPLPIADAISSDFPGAGEIAALSFPFVYPVTINGISFDIRASSATDNLFNILGITLLTGSDKTVLSEPGSSVITQSCAQKLFGQKEAMGQVFTIRTFGGDKTFTVTGIVKDPQVNCEFHTEIYLNWESMNPPDWKKNWWWFGTHVLVKVKNDSQKDDLERKANTILGTHNAPFINGRYDFHLVSLSGSHFRTAIENPLTDTVSSRLLWVLAFIAVFIILIACINFVNLAISQSEKSFKETGIHIVFGATGKSLAMNFILLTFFKAIISMVVAMVFVKLLINPLRNLMQINDFNPFSDMVIWVSISGLVIVSAFLSGVYPAMMILRARPVTLLSGRKENIPQQKKFRQALVIIQFSVALMLTMTSLFIFRQISFVKNHNLGFNAEGLFALDINTLSNDQELRGKKTAVLEQEISKQAEQNGILKTGLMESVPGTPYRNAFTIYNPDNLSAYTAISAGIDENYSEVLQLPLTEGRNFSEGFATDRESILINETLKRQLGWNSIENKQLALFTTDNKVNVIGVLHDVNINSLDNAIPPMIYRYKENSYPQYMVFRINPGNEEKATAFIKSEWKKVFESEPFNSFTITDKFNAMYGNEERLLKIIGGFCFIALVLLCFGLLAQVAYSVYQRTKEIGIRKVNGAGIVEVMAMLNKDFVKWIVIGFLIAVPIAYYAVYKWLESFTYKTALSWWIFVLAGLIVMGIALLTVSWQSWRAATRNPIEALRYE